ncbi:DNA primase [Candidatus Nomurabacteria bacterium]|nr:DNA primase [Candidatus Nomurabacteria bacterium]
MNSPVQKIKERLSIEEVVSSYIKLEKSGANFKARCPFHNEKTPSFYVSPDRESYYCFGCSAKGDIFTFVEEFEGLDFKGALKLLAERAGVPLEGYNKEVESEKERLYRVMEEATKYFSKNLTENQQVLSYLKNRGLQNESIKDFRIGFAKNDWRELYNYLKNKNFNDKDIELAGLIKSSEKGFYDRFRGRIIFPIADSSGRVIAFSGRIFDDLSADSGQITQAKYLNSPETPIFNKSSVFFGIDKAKDSIRKNNFSILVEGQMDLVLSHQAGFKNTIASSGTALSDSTISKENVISNLGLVLRLSDNIVLAFDSDKAGEKASFRAGRIALSLGMDVKVAMIPEGFDPADLISKQGVEAWKSAIRNSKHLIEFLLDKALKKNIDDMRKVGREIQENILPFINALDSSIEKMHFIKKISDKTQIPEKALQDDLKKVEKEMNFEKVEISNVINVKNKVFRKDYIERRLMGVIFWQQKVPNPKIETNKILQDLTDILKISKEEIIEKNKNDKEGLIYEAEVFYDENVNLEQDIQELLFNLKEEFLKEELFKKMQELNLYENNKDREKSNQILKEISEINKKIQEIKNGRLNK